MHHMDQCPHHYLPQLILSLSHPSEVSTVIQEAFTTVEEKCIINGSSVLKLVLFNVLLSG